MRATFWRFEGSAVLAVVLAVVAGTAAPINPEAFKRIYEEKSKTAEVVAQVQVVAVVCTETAGEGKNKSVTLQVSLQVLEAEKGPVKKNELVVVPHKVQLPAGPGPGSYGYMAALRQFPFVPGVKGNVALNWDKEKRSYVVVAGWVPEAVALNAAIPTEVGKVAVAGEPAKPK